MMKEMYKGIVNSPITSLSEDIGAKDTDIKVVDSSYLPAAPNLAVIGTEGTAETIKYAGINENILTGCTRGFQGTAKAWAKDTLIARNFTEYDLAAVQENITTLDIEKASNQEFTEFKGNIQNQLDEHEAQAETNLKNYAKKTDLSAAETRLDKKIDVKVSNTTFEDFKNTNQTALDKKTNNTDFDIYKKEVTSNLAKKVDKVVGKGLSTNDYTDLEKVEVAKIKNLATNETVAGIKSEVATQKDLQDLIDNLPSMLDLSKYEKLENKGKADGYAPLGTDGKVLAKHLPVPAKGLELGETENTAYRGDRGKKAYEHSLKPHAPEDAYSKEDMDNIISGIKTSALKLGETKTTALDGYRGMIAFNHAKSKHADINAITEEKAIELFNKNLTFLESPIYHLVKFGNIVICTVNGKDSSYPIPAGFRPREDQVVQSLSGGAWEFKLDTKGRIDYTSGGPTAATCTFIYEV